MFRRVPVFRLLDNWPSKSLIFGGRRAGRLQFERRPIEERPGRHELLEERLGVEPEVVLQVQVGMLMCISVTSLQTFLHPLLSTKQQGR